MSMADIIGVPATQGDVGWGETAKQTTPAAQGEDLEALLVWAEV